MRTHFITLCIALSVLVGCSNDKDANDRDPDIVDVDVNEQALAHKRDEFVRGVKERMKAVDARQEELERKMAEAGDETRQEFDETAKELEAQREKLSQQLDEAGKQTAESWDDFKASVAGAAKDLEDGYNEVLERMKSE